MAQTRDPHDKDYTSDWPIDNQSPMQTSVTDRERRLRRDDAEDEDQQAPRRDDYVRSEQAVMADGQLGGGNLDSGPEESNPEGSNDLNNKQYWERSNTVR